MNIKQITSHFILNFPYFLSKNGSIATEMIYSTFRQGHLIFSNDNSFVDVSGGDIRDKRVIIKNKNGETFTINGWISE